MNKNSERPVGLTKDAGYQVGARRTLPVRLEAAWGFLISPAGVALWLGEGAPPALSRGAAYRLADGTTGQVRVMSPDSHLRLTWRQPGWPRASTLQLRVIPKGDRTVIAFHQEHLPDATAREQRRDFFLDVLDRLAVHFDSGPT